eukprot:gnl/TRDRNA2_/TRDRNA2_53697_c0_seq1.p1 gnl/TRDRNA2_/TRDRNA2_53697_c0~~gnl/TRDRNA2_/TRDRNA2_53697_c0_seq1.p1  ORF type:complete len:435 (-),score=83.07 gnl/TRDRNA2_/TRDRNA2_53697_c0_seq1:74-1378(-)
MWLLAALLVNVVLVADATSSQARVQTHMGTGVRGQKPNPQLLTPPCFVIASSPMGKKVTYTLMENFVAVEGEAFPLIDAGLSAPYGVAYDPLHSVLYVADFDARKIIGYELAVRDCNPEERNCKLKIELSVASTPFLVQTNVQSQWLAIDNMGSLFYSDQAAATINKIDGVVLEKLKKGEITNEDLVHHSELEGEALAAAQSEMDTKKGLTEAQKITMQEQRKVAHPTIETLYDSNNCEHVATPSGLATDGIDLYWGNQANARNKGAVVMGKASPEAPLTSDPELAGQAAHFESEILAVDVSDATYGVAKTHNLIIFADKSQYVWGVPRQGGAPVAMGESFDQPRGIVWDGDGTLYVADKSGRIYSMPCGQLGAQPISRAVNLHDAFGLAIVKGTDPAFKKYEEEKKAKGSASTVSLAALILAASWSATAFVHL